MLKAPKSATVTVDGIDLGAMFGAFLAEGTSMPAPEPKTYTVDVPGGNGCIDLTEALTGDVAYKNRDAELVLAVPHPENWERSKSQIYSFLHGRQLPFTLGVDPGYTYTGRFSVEEDEYHGLPPDGVGIIKVKVSTNPYKLRERCSYRLNATGGRMYRLESGRRPVHPTIECDSACWVTWRGKTVTVPPGAFVLRDVVFREGWNEIYVNSQPLWLELWGDLSEGGKDAMTWGQAGAFRWDGLHRLGLAEDAPQCWADIAGARWADLGEGGAEPRRWTELDYRHGTVADSTVYLIYDWEDL